MSYFVAHYSSVETLGPSLKAVWVRLGHEYNDHSVLLDTDHL